MKEFVISMFISMLFYYAGLDIARILKKDFYWAYFVAFISGILACATGIVITRMI